MSGEDDPWGDVSDDVPAGEDGEAEEAGEPGEPEAGGSGRRALGAEADGGAVVSADYRCGFAAIVGRPNVGKSTLLNAILKRKVSIVSPKPQTTRNRILGIVSRPAAQIIFVDTPGIHGDERKIMNRYMNSSARASLADADVTLFVVEALRWMDEDQRVLEALKNTGRPILALVNKVDRIYPKDRLLPYIGELNRRADFREVIPLSGLKSINVDQLLETVVGYLPLSPPHFPQDQVTDRSDRFQAAEIIREKLTWRLRQELPYGLAVEIERFETSEDDKLTIGAIIWVERTGQKAIVIGQGGLGLKEVGRAARLELVHLLRKPVHLELWVKVKDNWSNSEAALRQFGYDAN